MSSPASARANPAPRLRALACGRCGAAFSCTLGGPCWCGEEPFRLPVPLAPPAEGAPQDCLCPDCLRALAQAAMRDPTR